MVLQLFRLLLNMTFKRLNQNASHYKKKCPLLAGTLKSPKIDGAQMNSTQIVVTLISEKKLPHTSSPATQAVDTFGVVALLYLVKVQSVPHVPSPQESLSNLGLAAKHRCCSRW